MLIPLAGTLHVSLNDQSSQASQTTNRDSYEVGYSTRVEAPDMVFSLYGVHAHASEIFTVTGLAHHDILVSALPEAGVLLESCVRIRVWVAKLT